VKKKETRKSKGKRELPIAKTDGTSEPETTAPEVSGESSNIASVPVVGVGASAGGLEAFTQLLNHLPPDTGFAFVFVQHLDPRHASVLPKILSAKTRMRVREATDGDVLKPNVVFVLPADRSITISQGLLRLSPRLDTGGLHHPIDAFLRSLAIDRKSRAIGVILSGSGSDGAFGIQAIKDAGGIIFAQDEKSSQHAGMPQSAIATGCVDFVLPPEGIAKELARLGGHSYIVQQPAATAEEPAPPQGNSLRQIFTLLRNISGIDFSQYQQSSIQRRLQRRMALAQAQKVDDYLAYVLKHKGELSTLLSDFLIKTTRFFRDKATFEFLAQRVLPSIMKGRSAEEPLRIWVPACSTGEETYALLICLMEWIALSQNRVEVKMFASDVSESAISQARKGSYPENISEDVSAERLGRFFTRNGLRYEAKPSLRRMCVFAKHNLIKAPPFSRMDLISCRNLLIYLGRTTQGRVLSILHYALKPGGTLLLGASEGVNEASHLFHQIDKRFKVFSKQPSSEHFRLRPAQEHLSAESPPGEGRRTEADAESAADRITLARYAPPGVLINEDMTILEFRGDTSRYIRPAAGKASLNLIAMLHEGLQLGLRSAVLKAKKEKGSVRKRGLRFVHKGHIQSLSVDVTPIPSGPSGERSFLIVFLEGGEAEVSKPAPHQVGRGKTGGESAEISALKRELAETNEYLKSVAEDQSISLEQLQATNEELESANEELQSTNEELETSKEEIDATNEELNTVNAELTDRSREMTQLSNYIEAVFNTVSEPLLLLDPVLRVKQANRSFYELFRVSEKETVGRFVSELATGRWAVTDWPQLGKFLGEQSKSENLYLDLEFPSIGHRHIRVNARPVQLPQDEDPTILMALEDITSTQDLVREQQRLIHQLSAPVLTLQKQIMVLPIIGLLNAERMQQVKATLLEGVRQHRAKVVILDITGAAIENEGEGVAKGFQDITKASQLVGATAILTGISREIAERLVSLVMDRSKLTTMGDLQSGLAEANRMLGYQVIANEELEILRQAKRELDVLRKKQFITSALPPKDRK
jgi:two-component system CheB/CheR fusion protein